MDFIKVEGLGNDFIVFDGPVALDASVIEELCDRRRGIGADGVLEMSRIGNDRIGMRYWNADGSEAEMCGNGLRCLVRLAVDRGWVDTTDIVVETAAGPLPASLRSDGQIRAKVGSPELTTDPFDVDGVPIHPITVGNPHAVIFVDDVRAAPVAELGRRIEHHERFPMRANVEFVAVTGPRSIDMRVWERGVGETMASGTGATSAAFAAASYRDVEAPVDVRLPGGNLSIEFEAGEAWMIGPGNEVYRGSVDVPSEAA